MSSVEFRTAFVIDDERLVLNLASSILGLHDIQVQTFGNPEWALGRMGIVYPNVQPGELCIPDLIVTDYNYQHPTIDGISLIRSVREIHPSLPIILMSGDLVGLESRISGLDLAATLIKPFQIIQLEEAINRALIWKQNHP